MSKPTIKSTSEVFVYTDSNRKTGQCDLQIIRTQDWIVCIASERADNRAMSITNAIEYLVAQVVKQHGMDIRRLIWIEHYYPAKGEKPEYELATFKMTDKRTLTKPDWRAMDAEDWRELGLEPR